MEGRISSMNSGRINNFSSAVGTISNLLKSHFLNPRQEYSRLKSYIKIFGPPLLGSIRALERIAVDMPEVCIMDSILIRDVPRHLAKDIGGYFSDAGIRIPTERCESIISKSGESLGEYDFFFEWSKKPDAEQLNDLIVKIDEALAPLGSRYTITTKPR